MYKELLPDLKGFSSSAMGISSSSSSSCCGSSIVILAFWNRLTGESNTSPCNTYLSTEWCHYPTWAATSPSLSGLCLTISLELDVGAPVVGPAPAFLRLLSRTLPFRNNKWGVIVTQPLLYYPCTTVTTAYTIKKNPKLTESPVHCKIHLLVWLQRSSFPHNQLMTCSSHSSCILVPGCNHTWNVVHYNTSGYTV